ncbi:MAG: F0F1 ATP synthase subunit alpha, partial [Gammaproteobacteria bacterium]|nr:F0F1 ATP synthase subunit alpha [Gammaproteobacteria bacterium]
MRLNPSEMSEIIKKRIAEFKPSVESRVEGTIVSVEDGIVRIHGLDQAMQGEMLEFQDDIFGLVLNLERDIVGAIVLGDYEHLSEGQTVRCTGRILEVPVGDKLLGRTVDALGVPVDNKGDLGTTLTSPIEKIAPGV